MKVINRCLSEADLRGARGARALSIFWNHLLFFCNHFEELKTVLFEVKLINNASLTYVYPNTIETCLTPNHFYYLADTYSTNTSRVFHVVTNLTVLLSTTDKI